VPSFSAAIKTITARTGPAPSAFWLGLDRAVRIGLGFVVSVLVARHLGPEGNGLLAAGLALAALLASLVELGLDIVVRRELVRSPARAGELLGTMLGLRIMAVAPTAGIFLWLFSRQTDGGHPLLGVLLAVTVALPVAQTLETWFLSRDAARQNVLAQSTALVTGALARGALALAGATVVAFGAVAAAETVLVGGFLYLFYRRERPVEGWRFDRATARTLLRAAAPLLATTAAITIYRRADIIMLTHLTGEAAAGTYAVAVKLAEAGYVAPMVLVNAWFPRLTRLHAEDRPLYRAELTRFFRLVTWLGVAFAVVATVAATHVVPLIYGAKFSGAAQPLALYAWTAVLIGQGIARSQWLLLENLQVHGLWFALIGAGVNVALNALLIPRYGPSGAALACLGAHATSLYLAPLFFPQTRTVWRAGLGAFFFRPAPPNL
jgi:O-antigen/teichoic acid export membrane protein